MVGNAAMAVAALLAPRCSLAYSHEEVREGQLIPEGSRSEQGTLMGVGPQLCELLRTPSPRTSENPPSTHSDE
jgi:hypothetical protein